MRNLIVFCFVDLNNFVILFCWPLSAGARNHSGLRNTYIWAPDVSVHNTKTEYFSYQRNPTWGKVAMGYIDCLLYTSDAADE